MKLYKKYQEKVYIYKDLEEREKHGLKMKDKGWEMSTKTHQLKDDVSIMLATEKDYAPVGIYYKY